MAGPKTIDQIHKEVAREAKAQQHENDFMFAMKSWRHGGIRFFATLVPGKYFLWHLWVTAACGMNDAEKFRAEIRLSSNLVPDCSDVFYRPGKIWSTKCAKQSSRKPELYIFFS